MPGSLKPKAPELRKAVDVLVADYAREGILPTDFRLMERLGIGDDELESFYQGGRGREAFRKEMRRLIVFRRQICVENLAQGKQATGWVFLSKQARWGGLKDAQKGETASREPVEILLRGADGKPMRWNE